MLVSFGATRILAMLRKFKIELGVTFLVEMLKPHSGLYMETWVGQDQNIECT